MLLCYNNEKNKLFFCEKIMTYGKYNISAQDHEKRKKNVEQALAIVGLEEQLPGSNVISTYDDYINGDLTWNECSSLIPAAAIKDLQIKYATLAK